VHSTITSQPPLLETSFNDCSERLWLRSSRSAYTSDLHRRRVQCWVLTWSVAVRLLFTILILNNMLFNVLIDETQSVRLTLDLDLLTRGSVHAYRACKDKACHTPWGVCAGCSSPWYRPWARRWMNHWSMWWNVRPMVAFPAAGHHRPLTCTALYLPKVVTWKRNGQELNPRPLSRKSNALTNNPQLAYEGLPLTISLPTFPFRARVYRQTDKLTDAAENTPSLLLSSHADPQQISIESCCCCAT